MKGLPLNFERRVSWFRYLIGSSWETESIKSITMLYSYASVEGLSERTTNWPTDQRIQQPTNEIHYTKSFLNINSFSFSQIICILWNPKICCSFYKTKGRGLHSRWGHWNFSLVNPSGRTIALGSTLPLIEMSTRNFSWRVKAAGA
jgi:hypothetical protein